MTFPFGNAGLQLVCHAKAPNFFAFHWGDLCVNHHTPSVCTMHTPSLNFDERGNFFFSDWGV